jgi:hypothetical protein
MYLGHEEPGVFTHVILPDDLPLDNMMRTLCDNDGVWAAHQTSPQPTWVEGDDVILVTAVSKQFGCPIGRPEE